MMKEDVEQRSGNDESRKRKRRLRGGMRLKQ